MDLIGSSLLLLLFSPLILFFLIALSFNPPVFFLQKRAGKKGHPFTLLKLRSMDNLRGGDGELLPDSQRTTRLGRIIRGFSIDELIQLINVIKGDMSLVGPRPLLLEYLPLYSERQLKRHLVKPGITGLAQIRGRNSISWKERLDLDVLYVEKMSFILDLKILLITPFSVLRRSGVEHATGEMPPFRGAEDS